MKFKNWGSRPLFFAPEERFKLKAEVDDGQVKVALIDLEKMLKFCTRIMYGPQGIGGEAILKAGKVTDNNRYDAESTSAFDPTKGEVATLKANSKFLTESGGELQVVELTTGLYYFVPFGGIPKEAVSVFRLRLPVKLQLRNPEIEADLMLPNPVNDEYDWEDYSQAVVKVVVNYKNRLAKVSFASAKDEEKKVGSEVENE